MEAETFTDPQKAELYIFYGNVWQTAGQVHSKLDYCNSLYHNLPNCQLNRLQRIQNSLAHAVVKAPKSTRITPILKSLHWLKVNECIEYKLLSLTWIKLH